MGYKGEDEEDVGLQAGWSNDDKQGRRIHELQQEINFINPNLTAYNCDKGVYNYQLKYEHTNSLFKEVMPKISKDEKRIGKSLRNVIGDFILFKPIFIDRKNLRSGKIEPRINSENWYNLNKLLRMWEEMVVTLLDEHGLNTKNKEVENEDEL